MTNNGERPLEAPPWSARDVAVGTLVVAGVAAAFWLLVTYRAVFFSLFQAVVISTAISPAVDWLHRRGVPRPAGVVLIYLALLALLVGFVLLVAPLLAEQSAKIAATSSGIYSEALTTLRLSPSHLIRRLAWQLPGGVPVAPAPAPAGDETAALDAVANTLHYVGLAGRGLFVLVAVLLLAFYWTLDRERILRSLLLPAPMDRREGLRALYDEAEVKVGGYIRGVALLCLLVGTAAFAATAALGLPYALVLGLAAGLTEAVPVVGPLMGAVPAVLVALAFAPEKVLWVVLAYAVIQAAENTILVPRVMGRAVGVSPMVTLLALIAFGSVFGAAGALLAIPLAAVVQLLLDRYVFGVVAAEPEQPEGRDRLSRLRYSTQQLVQDARKRLTEKSIDLDDQADEVGDTIETLATDLDSLLARGTAGEKTA